MELPLSGTSFVSICFQENDRPIYQNGKPDIQPTLDPRLFARAFSSGRMSGLLIVRMKNKILIVTGIFPPDIGGPASYAKTVGQKLSESFKISVVTYSSVRKSAEDKNLKFKVVRVWRKNFWLFRHLSYFFKVMSLAGRNDVVFSLSTINGGITGLIAARFFKKKFFIRIVGDYAWQIAILKRKTNLLIDDFQKSERSEERRVGKECRSRW